MARKRNPENKGLPLRWRFTMGAYYYSVPLGQESAWDGKKLFRLGKTLHDSYREWTKRLDAFAEISTIGKLLDRYTFEVVPKKDVSSHSSQHIQIKQLRDVFCDLPLTSLKPRHVYLYVEKRKQKYVDSKGRTRGGMTAAEREVEILSHAFTKAVEWGYMDRHPFKGEVRIEGGSKPRTRYVEDWEILECMKVTSPRKKGSVLAIKAYIQLKIITGMDRGDILRLTMADLKEDGIHNVRGKTDNTTGKGTIYTWTPDLREAVELAKATRPALSPFLFCNRKGAGYYNEATGRADGWKNMWARFMDKLLEQTAVSERFTEHDLRAKAGSDAESLDQAQGLLAHADPATTERIYRRKKVRVTPLKAVK
jgi:integrase